MSLYTDLLFAGLSGDGTADTITDVSPAARVALPHAFSGGVPAVQQFSGLGSPTTLWGADYTVESCHTIPGLSFGFRVPGDFTNTGLAYDSNVDGSGNAGFWIADFTNGGVKPVYTDGTSAGSLVSLSGAAGQIQGVALDTSRNILWTTYASGTTAKRWNKDGTSAGADLALSLGGGGLAQCAYDAANDWLWAIDGGGTTIKATAIVGGATTATLTPASLVNGDGITIDPADGSLWVTDDNGGSAEKLRHFDQSGAVVSGPFDILPNPEGIVVVGALLYICHDAKFHSSIQFGNRVVRYDKATGVSYRPTLRTAMGMSCFVRPAADVAALAAGLMGDASGGEGFFLASIFGNPRLRVNNQAGTSLTLDIFSGMSAGTWYHLAASAEMTGASNNVKIWKDGSLTQGTLAGTAFYARLSEFCLGQFFSASNGWSGDIAAPCVWNRALIQDDVDALLDPDDAFYQSFSWPSSGRFVLASGGSLAFAGLLSGGRM